jgi:NAD-dependent deacetylase
VRDLARDRGSVTNVDERVVRALREAQHVVVLTGSGASAESGVPKFRDKQVGLWERFDAMELATPAAFRRDPALVWGWYEWRRTRSC